MVLPFLAIYMTSSLGYSLKAAGIIMAIFGAGSMLGSFLGGKFTDKIGPFNVMLFSLLAGGCSYFILAFITNIYALGAAVFICATINESLRPANSSMVANFTTSDTLTRSYSLLRMAINLGVAIGPALAGILAGISYQLLFFGDAITNLGAAALFYFYFRNKKPTAHIKEKEITEPALSPYRDAPYLIFILFCLFYAMAFFQIFNGLPLYYKEIYHKSEVSIGLLLGLNGLIVFIFEMFTVSTIENRYRPVNLIITGSLMLGAAYLLLNVDHSNLILIISMILLSFSEIFAMPFMISHAMKSSKPQTRGSYIGAYTVVWSLAMIITPYIGTLIITEFNFNALWWVMGLFCLSAAIGFAVVMNRPRKVQVNEITEQ